MGMFECPKGKIASSMAGGSPTLSSWLHTRIAFVLVRLAYILELLVAARTFLLIGEWSCGLGFAWCNIQITGSDALYTQAPELNV